jgi:uncharacterized protein (DUF58 family)
MALTGKDISLVPTQHGFLFLGILFAMLLGSVNYNNNAGFVLVFLLGSMALISLALSYKNLLGLEVSVGQPHPVFAGDSGFFPVTVTAPQGQALLVFIDQNTVSQISASPGSPASVGVSFTPPSRGIHTPAAMTLTSVYPLGLFRLKAVIPNHRGMVVYPAPAPGAFDTGYSGISPEGDEASHTRGPDDFQGLSPYAPGSPVGHISWKTLSRGKGLFIKNFTAETGQDLLFDLEKLSENDLEKKLSLLCRAVLDAEKTGVNYGLRLGAGLEKKPDCGNRHMQDCLTALSGYGEGP